MPRSKQQSREVFKGDVIGAWKVVSDAPVRTPQGLVWRCRCESDHARDIPHHDLAFNVSPTCSQCVEAERQQRAADKVNEKRIVKEAAAEMLEQLHKEQAQSVQIAGLGEPNKPLGHIRSIQVEQIAAPRQQEGVA